MEQTSNTMTLEEIISAAVQKQVSELIQNALDGSSYRDVRQHIESRISVIAHEEFAKRETELRAAIAVKVQQMDFLDLEIKCYSALKPRQP